MQDAVSSAESVEPSRFDKGECVLQLVGKRPVSPHVFEIDGKGMHYKMPINAVTSIMNRVTGTVLTLGVRSVRQGCVLRLLLILLTYLPNLPIWLHACKYSPFHLKCKCFEPRTDLQGVRIVAAVAKELACPSYQLRCPLNTRVQPYGAGAWGAGAVALQGDLVAAVDAFKAAAPMLVLPAKFAVAFPLVYHYLGGLRHVFWDKSHYGNMARPQGAQSFKIYIASSAWSSVVWQDNKALVACPSVR